MTDTLGDRMKQYYETVTKIKLVHKMPVIIRLDMCHGHSFTKNFKKPFDTIMVKTMQDTMKYLCQNIQNCVLGYTQSDEISLLLIDYSTLNTMAWFDDEVQKMVSVSASLATLAFNKFYAYNIAEYLETDEEFKQYSQKINQAVFDSRVFNIPKEEVVNYFYWRQKDAERNSINSLAQSLFPHKSLQGLNLKETLTKIEQEGGIVWGELPTTQKRGSCCTKTKVDATLYSGYYTKKQEDGSYVTVLNTHIGEGKGCWVINDDIPQFKDMGRHYIEKLVYVGE